ncbi:MAG: hypothetical protein NVSMB70_20560 [Chamaesiphon sp.]
MLELTCNVSIPNTPQELEQAIEQYKSSDMRGLDLVCHWQAIRDASLNQSLADPDHDRVAGEDSY